MVSRQLRRLLLVGVLQTGALNLSAQTAVSGVIRMTGTAPIVAVPDMSSDPWCASNAGLPSRRVGSQGGVAEVVVYVTGAPPTSDAAAPVVLDQSGCLYRPGILGLQTGQELVIRNSDETLHNVHVSPENNRGFNIGQPLKGLESRRQFDSPEHAIPVKCDIHGWMTGHIFVFDHPYFTVTDPDGRFSLPPLPAGRWTVHAWHPTLGSGETVVTAGDGPVSVEITLRP